MKPKLAPDGLLDVAKKGNNPKGVPEQIQSAVRGLLDFAPGIGDVLAAAEAWQAAKNGDYVGAGLLGLGALPIIPAMTKMKLFHGSPDPALSQVENKGLFGGIFASDSPESAASHGKHLFSAEVPESKVLTTRALEYDIDYDQVDGFLRSEFPSATDDEIEALYDTIVADKGLFRGAGGEIPDDRLYPLFREFERGEADWAAQAARGRLAKKLGFDAVEMADEHGISYLLLPGNKLSPHK